MSRLRYAQLSYELERYQDAYKGYSTLLAVTKIAENRTSAQIGMMRSAYRCKDYESSVSACDLVAADPSAGAEVKRESDYVKAKSCLALSRRDEAMAMFRELSVESGVYEFSQVAGSQSYWLAKAYLVLGDSFAERGNYTQAKATWESVRDGYEPADSRDDIASGVKMRLERLETLMQN